MFAYTVTATFADSRVADEWITWLRNGHIGQVLEGGAIEKPPWYEPSDSLPKEPVIRATPEMEFDSLVVDAPSAKAKSPALRAVPATDRENAKT